MIYQFCNEQVIDITHLVCYFFVMKDKILQATIDIGARNGLAGISIQTIAKKCGIGSSTIYYHFKDKHELLLQSIMHVGLKNVEVMNNAIISCPSASLDATYKAILKTVAKNFIKNKNELLFFVNIVIMPNEEIAGDMTMLKAICPLSRLLGSGAESGLVQDFDYILSVAYHPMCLYLANHFVNKQKVDMEKVDALIDSMWNCIKVQPTPLTT